LISHRFKTIAAIGPTAMLTHDALPLDKFADFGVDVGGDDGIRFGLVGMGTLRSCMTIGNARSSEAARRV
jgi:hypothetical protein